MTSNNKTRKDVGIQCYKIMAVSVVLYGSKKWAKKSKRTRIQIYEITILRQGEGMKLFGTAKLKYKITIKLTFMSKQT
jgi:hypothetical protein